MDLKNTFIAAAVRQRKDPFSLISHREVFGDLIDIERLVTAYSDAVASQPAPAQGEGNA
ncbi:hypothetical protein ACIP9X_18355 [Arthrobacter sp. NPDC093125]|uniref:hypothetical protein n=1 Tax=Arthrobacter sp. NPDC093125 TaxID=3363944 RepID=UPI0037F4D8B0